MLLLCPQVDENVCSNSSVQGTPGQVKAETPGSEAVKAEVQCDWKEFTSPDGRKYYYNRVTKTSVWQMPEELKRAQALAAGAKAKSEANSVQARQ